MRASAHLMCPVVASFALLACEEQVIVFEGPGVSDAGSLPFSDEPADPIAADDGSMPLLAPSPDALGHMMGPVAGDAGPDNARPDENETVDASRGCASDPRVEPFVPERAKLGR